MSKPKIILNADDLGLSLGVNKAIFKAHHEGYLSHASLMANGDFFEDALQNVIRKSPDLKVGLHINLTCCRALTGSSAITGQNGILNNNFVKILFKRKDKKTLTALENEIEAQLLKIKNSGVQISHIDGHEHIHIIPSINKIVRKLAQKYYSVRIREINESFAETFKHNLRTASPANIIKLFLLKFLSLFNENRHETAFYSILNTCEINGKNLFSYLENTKSQQVEVMLHPGLREFDTGKSLLDARFQEFLKSKYRKQEFDLCFCRKFEEYEVAE